MEVGTAPASTSVKIDNKGSVEISSGGKVTFKIDGLTGLVEMTGATITKWSGVVNMDALFVAGNPIK